MNTVDLFAIQFNTIDEEGEVQPVLYLASWAGIERYLPSALSHGFTDITVTNLAGIDVTANVNT